jgi:hypothetical protein
MDGQGQTVTTTLVGLPQLDGPQSRRVRNALEAASNALGNAALMMDRQDVDQTQWALALEGRAEGLAGMLAMVRR